MFFKGEQPTQQHRRGLSLCEAIDLKDTSTLKDLLLADPDCLKRETNGAIHDQSQSPLIHAVIFDRTKAFQTLVEVSHIHSSDLTACLRLASDHGADGILRYLLGNLRLNVNESHELGTILHHCAAGDRPAALQVLFDCGVNPTIPNQQGETALAYARVKEIKEMLEAYEKTYLLIKSRYIAYGLSELRKGKPDAHFLPRKQANQPLPGVHIDQDDQRQVDLCGAMKGMVVDLEEEDFEEVLQMGDASIDCVSELDEDEEQEEVDVEEEEEEEEVVVAKEERGGVAREGGGKEEEERKDEEKGEQAGAARKERGQHVHHHYYHHYYHHPPPSISSTTSPSAAYEGGKNNLTLPVVVVNQQTHQHKLALPTANSTRSSSNRRGSHLTLPLPHFASSSELVKDDRQDSLPLSLSTSFASAIISTEGRSANRGRKGMSANATAKGEEEGRGGGRGGGIAGAVSPSLSLALPALTTSENARGGRRDMISRKKEEEDGGKQEGCRCLVFGSGDGGETIGSMMCPVM